jgi:hypothetical protein
MCGHSTSIHAIRALQNGKSWTGNRDKVRCTDKDTDTWTWYLHGNAIVTLTRKGVPIMFADWCGWFTRTTATRLNTLQQVMNVHLPKTWRGKIEVKDYPICDACNKVIQQGTLCPDCEFKRSRLKGGRDSFSLKHKEALNGKWLLRNNDYCLVQYYEGLDAFYCIVNCDSSKQFSLSEAELKYFLRRNFAKRETVRSAA